MPDAGDEIFCFGDGNKVQSTGYIVLRAALISCDNNERADVSFRTDVIDGMMPLLISHRVLMSWKRTRRFGTNAMALQNRDIKLRQSNTGHILVKLENRRPEITLSGRELQNPMSLPRKTERPEAHFAGILDVSEMNAARLRKLHEQRGHSVLGRTNRTLKIPMYPMRSNGMECAKNTDATSMGVGKEGNHASTNVDGAVANGPTNNPMVGNSAGSIFDGRQAGAVNIDVSSSQEQGNDHEQKAIVLSKQAALELTEKVNLMVSDSWYDVVDECQNQMFARLGNSENRCGRRRWAAIFGRYAARRGKVNLGEKLR